MSLLVDCRPVSVVIDIKHLILRINFFYFSTNNEQLTKDD
jgi:hypothetical protein